jgi:rubrerythrin
VRRDLEEALRAALEDADFHRKLIPLIVDVVEGVLDCRACDGSGRMHLGEGQETDCPGCHGSGLHGRPVPV